MYKMYNKVYKCGFLFGENLLINLMRNIIRNQLQGLIQRYNYLLKN